MSSAKVGPPAASRTHVAATHSRQPTCTRGSAAAQLNGYGKSFQKPRANVHLERDGWLIMLTHQRQREDDVLVEHVEPPVCSLCREEDAENETCEGQGRQLAGHGSWCLDWSLGPLTDDADDGGEEFHLFLHDRLQAVARHPRRQPRITVARRRCRDCTS